MDITAQYHELFLSHWPNIRSLRLSHPKMSPPLLLNPPDAYARQATRLFVIGQETPDWYDDEFEGPNAVDLFSAEAVEVLMRIYKNDRRRQTPFHQAVRDLERALGIEQEASLWSNLNKAGESRKPPSPELADALLRHFPVLRREVAIAKPNVVVFFTGP